jgi:hypothetical protein
MKPSEAREYMGAQYIQADARAAHIVKEDIQYKHEPLMKSSIVERAFSPEGGHLLFKDCSFHRLSTLETEAVEKAVKEFFEREGWIVENVGVYSASIPENGQISVDLKAADSQGA